MTSACQHQLFEDAASRFPGATAVVAGASSLTFAELEARANRLAAHLQSRGVGPDVLVGVALGRSLELAVALLGVLKAGGACLPLDPSHPPARLRLLLDDAAPAAVLTTAALAGRLPPTDVPLLRLDADAETWSDLPATPPPCAAGPEHVAYVIYTSGSTGQPKGVLLTHRGLVSHHRTAIDLYELGPADRVLQFCSLGFDASIEEIFPTWGAGAAVVLRPDDLPVLGRDWLGWLRAQRISVLNLPTAYWHQWARDLERLGEMVPADVRLVVVGGEPARGRALTTWLRVGGGRARWVNAYGPTEATCMSTVYEHRAQDGIVLAEGQDPPIGRPLPDTTMLIVDGQGRPVAPGATGELLLGGPGLARGYLRRPELTAERFIEDPAGHRLYRTGDLVRQLPSGDLEYVGRDDQQVKIRGFRVECGEVEGALLRHPGVAEAAVVARPDQSGLQHLFAYVVASEGEAPPPASLRRFLAERLPDHLVPTAFSTLDALPRTAGGKLDRASLPAVETTVTGGRRVAPRTPAERAVAGIWARVLHLDVGDLGVDDDFFERGGHSLLATQVVAALREELGTATPLQAIFERPTVAGLAALVSAEAAAGRTAVPLTAQPRPPGARFPLSLAQEQMWALEAGADPPGLYNVTAWHRFDRRVDEAVLRRAVAFLVERHETLRTSVVEEDGRPLQVVAPGAQVELEVADLGALAEPERSAEVRRRTAEQDALAFLPPKAPLLRLLLLHLGDDGSRLVATFDHVICDGPSAEIFLRELSTVHLALAEHRAPDLAPLPVQVADVAHWQRAALTEDVLQAQLAWWAQVLQGAPLGPALPFDHLPDKPTRRIASRPVCVLPPGYQRLERFARASSSSVFVVCAAVVLAVLGRAGGRNDVLVSTTLSGRRRVELDGLIGMFAGIGRIRADLSGDPSFPDLVAQVRTAALGMFENQDVPFLRVRRVVWPDFPSDPLGVARALPVELGYFRTDGPDLAAELFFRGQLHPLSVTLHDDGTQIRGEVSYKLDFFAAPTVERLAAGLELALAALGADPSLRLSQIPSPPSPAG